MYNLNKLKQKGKTIRYNNILMDCHFEAIQTQYLAYARQER